MVGVLVLICGRRALGLFAAACGHVQSRLRFAPASVHWTVMTCQ